MLSMSEFDQDQLNELYRCYPDLKTSHSLPYDEVRTALSKLDCPVAGHELREALGDSIKPGKQISQDELFELYTKVMELRLNSQYIKKDKILKEAEEILAIDGHGDGRHTVSRSEERAFANWINKYIQVPETNLLPIDLETDGDLYERCKNGILLCKLINHAVPNTIDERIINKGKDLSSLFKLNENLTLVVNSAAAVGCHIINIGPEDISGGKRHLVLGLIWQLIRKSIVDTITLAQHSELVALLQSGETLAHLSSLKPEELLMRWVNYHLENAGCNRRITNFHSDIKDSVIYAHLMQQIAPDHITSKMIPALSIIGESEMENRALRVLENAKLLDAGTLLSPEDIYMANEKNQADKLNLGFVATLFNLYPGLQKNENTLIQQETLEEKTYRNWMNSMGVKPFVNNLYSDLDDGTVLLQLIEIIKPGVVDFKKVVTSFDPKMKLFQQQGNCAYAIECANSAKIKIVNVSGENIREGNPKLILAVCFQLMRAYTNKLLRQVKGVDETEPCEDKDILEWINQRLSQVGEATIVNFRDPSLATSRPIIKVLLTINDNSASLDMLSNDNFQNAVYALSVCRRAGARVYALPEHVRDLHAKMIITIFACLMVLAYSTE